MKNVLVYNVKGLNQEIGLTVEFMQKQFQENNIVYWDSTECDTEPKIFNLEDEIKIVDLSKEGK